MYGTVAKTRVKAENRQKLRELFENSTTSREVPGFVTSYMLYENDSDAAWLFAVFQDRATYDANAGDPAQDAEYQRYSALMEAEPEWHDGEIESF
jgi:quinol monooxygenase YgiN